MSKTKTAKKTAAPKSTKAKAVPNKKAKAAPAKTVAVGGCPKGGDHDWTDEGGERFCGKCKAPAPAKAAQKKAQATTEPPAKKLSAIDAAAKLLAETKEPLNCKAMIEGIAAKGYWTSPGGKTPHATLYSAIIREIAEKGEESRFTKTERGLFAAAN